MNRTRLLICFLLAGAVMLGGCRKEFKEASSVTVTGGKAREAIHPYPFDWWDNTAANMPAPTGYTIAKPWFMGANQPYDVDMELDYKQADGWELVYNTFTTTVNPPYSPAYFVLYNHYTGVYRIYLHLPDMGSVDATTYLQHSFELVNPTNSATHTSSILNYIGQDLVDVNTNQTKSTLIAPYQIQHTAAWYVIQFEAAYDPNLTTIPYSELQLRWQAQAVNVTSDTTNGVGTSTITGTITTPNSFNIGGAASSAALSVAGSYALDGLNHGIPDALYDAMKDGVTDGLTGAVKGLFSAILGHNSASSQTVNLSMNSTIKLVGNATNISGIVDTRMIIPGSIWDENVVGFVPGRSLPIGIFNISAKPTVHYTKTNHVGSVKGGSDSYTVYSYTLDQSSYSMQYNSELSSIADITGVTKTLLLLGPFHPSASYTGSAETVGSYSVIAPPTVGGNNIGLTVGLNQAGAIGAAVRITFTVTPKTGGGSYKITKTFRCNVVNP